VAEPLKHAFDARVVRAIAADLARAWPAFDAARFTREATRGLDALELTARGWHVAEALARHLPPDPARAADVLARSLGPELERTERNGMAPFKYLPHAFWTARHGVADFEAGMRLMHELTRRFTAEFSMRAFLERWPDATLARLAEWARDPSVHVRRAASESTRPRLPWAPRLRAFIADPAPVLALLERLKDDPEPYVRRSVANNLNDIAKDHPALVVATCRRWLAEPGAGDGDGRRWIVTRALRSLVKSGHKQALALLGAGARPRVRVEAVRVAPRRLRRGEEARVTLTLVSAAGAAQALLVDYAVGYPGARGAARRKVFKLARLTLPARGRVALALRVSFVERTTRRIHPGTATVELLVNGEPFPLGAVIVAA
jgi:3-methyladenine DNA glycosylase AlkC